MIFWTKAVVIYFLYFPFKATHRSLSKFTATKDKYTTVIKSTSTTREYFSILICAWLWKWYRVRTTPSYSVLKLSTPARFCRSRCWFLLPFLRLWNVYIPRIFTPRDELMMDNWRHRNGTYAMLVGWSVVSVPKFLRDVFFGGEKIQNRWSICWTFFQQMNAFLSIRVFLVWFYFLLI